ncbi:DUF3899 domain-containing protein [Halobacillus sp. Marseille-Q1614]|uniref:DUF3899 domain-containing protein n=1 Tax=Halobacillus sp. Marseille-Q1614 TaxID=2709134 RepID=UPI00156E7BDF|nr:DUF3899 domain-containing protein [Halobacillus sp. Marseille-Q1614]
MKFVRNKWGFLAINFVVLLLYFLIFSPAYSLLHFIDLLFYLCFFYLFIGLILWIIKGGFFDAITYSFRRVSNRIGKNKDYMEDIDDFEEKPLPSQMFKRNVVRFFLFQGISLLAGMAVLLVVYYMA